MLVLRGLGGLQPSGQSMKSVLECRGTLSNAFSNDKLLGEMLREDMKLQTLPQTQTYQVNASKSRSSHKQ